jgi:hypothetical protein
MTQYQSLFHYTWTTALDATIQDVSQALKLATQDPLTNEFIQLATRLSALQGELGASEPDGWKGKLEAAAADLRRAADALEKNDSMAGNKELAVLLRQDASHADRLIGQLEVMASKDISYGDGWGTCLQGPIGHLLQGVDKLINK